METVLIASVVAFLGSLLPLLAKAVTGWLQRQSGTKIQIKLNESIISLDNLNPEQVRKIVESLTKESTNPKPKPDQPGSN